MVILTASQFDHCPALNETPAKVNEGVRMEGTDSQNCSNINVGNKLN